MNILVLSPHRDDAAFSLGLAMKGWLAAGHCVTVLSVFTRSLSAPYSDADTVHPNDLLSYVSAMRRREDAEFLKLMPGLQMVDLNLKDAALRLRCTAEELHTLQPTAEDTAIPKIQKALSKLATQSGIDAILLPLAIGHHVDHLVVRDAALTFAATHAFGFYEDLSDALESGIEIEHAALTELSAIQELNLFTEALSPIILSADESVDAAASKSRIISVYASQIDAETVNDISQFTTNYKGGERVWANPAWLALDL